MSKENSQHIRMDNQISNVLINDLVDVSGKLISFSEHFVYFYFD